jgi:hypothetical protein
MAPGRADTRVQGAVPPGVAVELRQLASGATTNVRRCYGQSLVLQQQFAMGGRRCCKRRPSELRMKEVGAAKRCSPELQMCISGVAKAIFRSYKPLAAVLQTVSDGATKVVHRSCKWTSVVLQIISGGPANILSFCYFIINFVLQCLWRVSDEICVG